MKIDPQNAAANLNLGMLLGEESRFAEAEAAFRAALKREPNLAPAAYNLSLLLRKDHLGEAIDWARVAYRASPVGKYGWLLAVYPPSFRKDGRGGFDPSRRDPAGPGVFGFLFVVERVIGRAGRRRSAGGLSQGVALPGLPPAARRELEMRLRRLDSPGKSAR